MESMYATTRKKCSYCMGFFAGVWVNSSHKHDGKLSNIMECIDCFWMNEWDWAIQSPQRLYPKQEKQNKLIFLIFLIRSMHYR